MVGTGTKGKETMAYNFEFDFSKTLGVQYGIIFSRGSKPILVGVYLAKGEPGKRPVEERVYVRKDYTDLAMAA